MGRKIRVLIGKVGLDGHEAGAKLVARGLSEDGMEVIYTGPRQTPEQIVNAAIQEDVDVVGLSCLSGAHNYLFPRTVELLRAKGSDSILVIGGGIISNEDVKSLSEKGIKAVFGPGSFIKDIARFIRDHVHWE